MKNRSLRFILPLIIASSVSSNAALVINAIGTYDENTVNANAVEHVATGDMASYNNFKTFIAGEFTAGRGGVIDFESFTFSEDQTASNFNRMEVKYGSGLTSTLNVTRASSTGSANGNFSLRNDNYPIGTPISGAYALRSNTSNHHYLFGTGLSHLAFTVLSRTGARTLTTLITFDDGTTSELPGIAIATGTAEHDTFFSFTAPEGKAITHLNIQSANSGYIDIDDLAFVVIPEPSAIALGMLGALPLLRRRRR
jgi:hypothetical protein